MPFADIIKIDDESIAVVHELGVTAFDSKCEVLWKIEGHDILIDYELKDGEIVCEFEDGEVKTRKLKQG